MSNEPWKDYASAPDDGPWAEYKPKSPTQAEPAAPETAPAKSGFLRRAVGDTLVGAAKGVIGLGESVVGLGNLVTGGHAGKALESIGYDPKATHEIIGDWYSPEQKAALKEVEEADGFVDTAAAMLRNPTTILDATVQSAPLMFGGGAVARGLGAVGGLAERGLLRAAAGEGVIGAGSAAESTRQQTEDGLLTGEQAALAAASGAGTALTGLAGAGLAKKLGIGDIDVALAGGNTAEQAGKGVLRRAGEGALAEGVLEEMPQSVQEQVLSNLALDRPAMEGVPEAAAQGVIAGAAMGAPFAAMARPGDTQLPEAEASSDVVQPEVSATPVLGLPAPDGSPGFGAVQVFPDGTATTAPQREGLANVGLTPDVIAARTQHPAATPALADGSPIPNPAGGVLSRAVNLGVETGAVATTNPAQLAAEMAMQAATQQALDGRAVREQAQVEQAPSAAPPVNMDPSTGEVIQQTPADVTAYLVSAFTPGTLPKVSAISRAYGLKPQEAADARRAAVAQLKGVGDANITTQSASDPTIESLESGLRPAPDLLDGRGDANVSATQESASDASPAQVRAEPQALSYDESADVLETDITPSSGGAFENRGAAELMARRTKEGAKAVKVDDGWVVRMPGPQFQSGVAQPIDTGDGATDFLGDSRLAETVGAQSDNAGLIQLGADPRISAGEVDSAKTLYESVSADPQGLGNELAGVSDSQEFFRVGDAPLDASGADINPGTEQGSPGYAGTDSVLPSYSSDTQSSRTVGYEKLDGDSKSVVKARVLGGLNDPKVLQSVIELSPVQVMDVFAGEKVTTNSVRNNKSVLLDRLASAFDDPVLTPSVSSFIDAVVARHPDAFAGLAAEMKAGTSEGAGRASDNGTAVDTNAAGHTGDIGTFSQPTANNEANGQPTPDSTTPADRDDLERRAAEQAPKIAALSAEDARKALAAIGETKARDLRDPKETLARQHPDDVDTALASVAAAPVEAAQPEAFEHNGTRIYPARIKIGDEVVDRWAVESADNKARREAGERTIGGDSLHATLDAAKNAADMERKQKEQKQANDAAQKAASDAKAQADAARKADDLNGFTATMSAMQAGKVKAALDKQVRFDGTVMTLRERVESLHKAGTLAVDTLTESKIKPMSRAAFNRATQREQDAHEKKMKEAGEVTVYLVNGSELGKIAYDYAQFLLAKDSKPAAQAESEPEVAAKIDDLGEKIGGARKDTATSTGRKPKAAAEKDDRPTWAKRYEISQIVKSMDPSQEGRWSISDKRKKDRFGQYERPTRETFATREEAEAALPLIELGRQHRVVKRGDLWAIARDVTDRKRVIVKEGFSTREEALRHMAENATELLGIKTSVGEEALPLPDEVARTGPERRQGNVAGKDFMDTFGFRGVEFGNWNNQAERQEVMNHAYDGLLDMAEVLGIPPRAISLNGDLALAFGARGQGLSGARAHYEPQRGVINLTKMQGAGALAHEWIHALDHYFGRQAGTSSDKRDRADDGGMTFADGSAEGFLSNNRWSRLPDNMRAELRAAYKNIVDTMMVKAEEYVEDTRNAERFLAHTRDELGKQLANFRRLVAEPDKWGRKKGVASAEQLAEVDAIAARLLNGEDLGTRLIPNEKSKSVLTAYRDSNDSLERLNAIMQDVRGRQGFNAERRGVLDTIRYQMKNYAQRIKAMNDASAETVKSKRVPTSYKMEAIKADQGRASNYWATPHEMLARAFSSYVEDKLSDRGITSNFLSYGSEHRFALPIPEFPRPFPGGAEREAINAAFDSFFQTVQTKEEGGRVMLFSRKAPPRHFQPDASEATAFRQQFDRYVPSQLTNVPPLQVGRMPAVLRSLGVPDAIVTISRDIVRKASNKHYSERSALRALPEELADPVAVFESNSHPGEAMVVLTEIIDQRGQPVIVAIDMRRDGSVGRISSVYGKGSAKATFENWIKNGRLLYVSDRAKENAALKGLQLPNSNPRTGKVLRESDIVNSGDPASFSRAPEREGRSYSPNQVEADVADITARWVDSPPIEVVPTAADLPQDVVGELQRIGSDGSDIRGVYHPNGTIYVVRDNIISRRDLEETLFHEAIGHHGLRLIFGKGTERQLQRLVQAAGGWGGIKAYARRHGIDLSAYDFLATDPRLRDGRAETVLMDELFAHMAERMNDLEPSLRNRIAEFLGAVRAWLRQNGFELLAGGLSDGEMAHLLRRSERAVQGKSGGLQTAVRHALFQRVFHGTPHTVDRFSLQKIGTGEGNQVYGWGMYFASKREVAEHYRGSLGDQNERSAALRPAALDAVRRNDFLGFDTAGEALGAIRQHGDFAERWDIADPADAEHLRAYRNAFGNVYQVEVPEDSDLLDWDKPITEQPEKVRKLLLQVIEEGGGSDRYKAEKFNAAPTESGVEEYIAPGRVIYQHLASKRGAQGASEYLLSHGIQGLRYLDGGSRSNGKGSHNYVIWDEAAISEPEGMLFSMRETGRGERFIERGGQRFVEREGAFYLTDKRGQPADFRRAEAERMAREVGGVAVKDDGLPTWSVRLPDTTARAEARASGIRFSRRALGESLAGAMNNAADVRLPAGYVLGDLLSRSDATGKLSWWHKTVGTMFNLAERSPEFKRVFDSVQRMIGDVSQYANAAMDMAPDLLPKFDSLRDWKKRPIAGERAKRVSRAVFEGTTLWTRDEDGRPVRTDDIDRAGIVWTADELRQKFGMTPTEVGYYQQTRRAIDKSLNDTAISQMVKLAGDDVFDTRDEALAAPTARAAAMRLRDRLMEKAKEQPRRAGSLNETARQIMDMADKVDNLTERGYAPLSRFGRFTVYVAGDGIDPVFQMFETEREANRAARKLRGEFPRAQVEQGTLSEQQFRQFRGMTTETLELFGDILGLDATGDSAADQAFQSFLKAAKANRSAMKRLIHRQGIAGYSDDVSRVLANFIYSNARMTASNLNAGETAKAIAAIPKEQGQLKDAAIELSSYVDDPQDQGYKLGAFNFFQYIGGSIASAMVNLTQPLTMTFPWLSQYGGAWKAAAALKDAAMLAGKTGSTGDAELDHFLKRADADGITQPQEVHQLQAYAAGKGVLRSGDGTQAGDAAAKAYNAKARVMLLWGMPFSLAEQFNRRMTFIAAFNTARDQGMQDPYGFAVHAVQTTQGIYNKANKPAWARTTLGGMAFTFKQYSINYVEMLERMWRQGGPEGKKGVMLAMAVMYLLAGAGGLPGMDDLDDLIDGVLQRMGYNFNTKQAREQFFAGIVGETGAKFLEHGVSALPGMPIDVAGRLGMGNLVPSTGLLKKKDNYGHDVAELAGPTGDFITRSLQAVDALVQGEFYQAGKNIAPKAIDNLLKGGEMLATGEYRDTKGRKVVETTTGEAIAKSIGFQPPNVAAVQRDTWTQQEMISLVRQRESEIAGKWAQGIVDAKQSRIDEARDELADWNAKNPETPIRINSAQIKRRVMQLRMDKRERVAKAAPKEIRAAVRAQLGD